MEHKGSGNVHDCADLPFCNSILVVTTSSCKPHHLLEDAEMGLELLGLESGTIVSKVDLGNHSNFSACLLKSLSCSHGLMGIEMCLEINMGIKRQHGRRTEMRID